MFEPGQSYAQFLNDYYTLGPGGYMKFLSHRGRGLRPDEIWAEMGFDPDDELAKAALLSTTANYYANAYAAECGLQFAINTELYKLLDKKPMIQTGDSYKYVEAHGLTLRNLAPDSADAMFAAPTVPAPEKIEKILSPYLGVELQRSLANMLHEKVPDVKEITDWDWIRNTVAPKAMADNVETWLGGYETAVGVHGVDTPAAKHIDCIDRMVSSKVESGTALNWVTAVTAGDIFWDGIGTGTEKIDRSADTWADAQLTLGGTAATDDSSAFAILEEVDDLMALAKRHSTRNRYMAVTTPSTYHKICDEVEPGLRLLPDTVKVSQNIGGIDTYGGQDGGMDVGAIVSNGIRMPLFVSSALPTTNSIKTTATSGHLYMLDLDHIWIRVDMPMTYLETGFGVEMLHQNALHSRGALFIIQNLIADKFACHAALKWITA